MKGRWLSAQARGRGYELRCEKAKGCPDMKWRIVPRGGGSWQSSLGLHILSGCGISFRPLVRATSPSLSTRRSSIRRSRTGRGSARRSSDVSRCRPPEHAQTPDFAECASLCYVRTDTSVKQRHLAPAKAYTHSRGTPHVRSKRTRSPTGARRSRRGGAARRAGGDGGGRHRLRRRQPQERARRRQRRLEGRGRQGGDDLLRGELGARQADRGGRARPTSSSRPTCRGWTISPSGPGQDGHRSSSCSATASC